MKLVPVSTAAVLALALGATSASAMVSAQDSSAREPSAVGIDGTVKVRIHGDFAYLSGWVSVSTLTDGTPITLIECPASALDRGLRSRQK